MNRIYSALVLMHPVNKEGCFEILFSKDKKHYASIDGNSPDYFKNMGLTSAIEVEVTPMQFYRLLGKSLDIKIRVMDLYVKYRDYFKTLSYYKKLAEIITNAQCKYSEDLEIPESVIQLANCQLISPKH